MYRLLLIVLMMLVGADQAAAADPTMPESILSGSTNLMRNGIGVRTKFFVKVYAGGLYLAERGLTADEVVNRDEPMLVRMEFIYDGVSAEKLQDGWKEGFEITAPKADSALADSIARFVALFDHTVNAGEIYEISYLPGIGTVVSNRGRELAKIPGLDFKQALFAIWFGSDPVDGDLKDGMLNQS